MQPIQAIRCGLALTVLVSVHADVWAQAAGQAVRAANINRQRWVNSNDSVERVLLLTPGGPIVMKSDVYIDGQPHQVLRDKLIDDVLKYADTDGDGQPTWNEALQNPRFLYAPFRPAGGNEQQQEQMRTNLIKQYDQNGDGVADRSEVRMLLARSGGGTGFVIMDGFAFNRDGGGGRTDLKTLFDIDQDGVLTAEEITAAPERLKSRDANDNDLLEQIELGSGAAVTVANPTNPTVLPLGPSADFPGMFTALVNRYGIDGRLRAESFPLFPRLLDGLDRNANGELEADELAGFNSIRPQIAMTVRIKTSEAAPAEADAAGIAVTWLAPEFPERNILGRLENSVTLRFPSVRLTITAPMGTPQTTDFGQAARSLLNNFDKDKNGYLEKKELEEQTSTPPYVLQQFDRWDENGDGKVYPAEIEADYERQAAPQRSQVNLTASELGTGLFGLLDQSGDNRLSLREMRTAPDRLRKLDVDGDGRLSGTELPTEIQIVLSQGNRFGYNVPGMNQNPRAATTAKVPKWFLHMDRNDDGDVTLREFLGTAEKFRELDRNGDGFIEPAEAVAAQAK